MQLNREQRRALKKAKPVKGAGHIQLPINMRFSAQDETRLMQTPIESAERLRDGTADEIDWHTVMERLNWARVLNKANFDQGEQMVEEGQNAMRAIKARGLQYESWTASTPEFNTISVALVLCNQMQKSCTRRELRESLRNMLGANDYLNKKKQIQDRMDGR